MPNWWWVKREFHSKLHLQKETPIKNPVSVMKKRVKLYVFQQPMYNGKENKPDLGYSLKLYKDRYSLKGLNACINIVVHLQSCIAWK